MDTQEWPKDPNHTMQMGHAEAEEFVEDVAFYRTLIANVVFVGKKNSDSWFLIDCGIAHYADRIKEAAEKRYGQQPPAAIILTHGHFDHVGSVKKLAKYWNVPVYVHPLELDYVTGKKQYPLGDPTVGGGLFSLLSPFFPTDPVHIEEYARPLTANEDLLFLKEWRIIHTPGHTPGHISLFRESDRVLIAGDAFITVKQESSMAVFIQHQHVHGPPAYFTHDWTEAEKSVQRLAKLNPSTAVTGHGLPMEGELLLTQLQDLAANFKELAVPKHQRKIH